MCSHGMRAEAYLADVLLSNCRDVHVCERRCNGADSSDASRLQFTSARRYETFEIKAVRAQVLLLNFA